MKLRELNKELNNVNPKAKISDTVDFYKNAVGIYIAGGVSIGSYCKIYPRVTIGKRHGSHTGVPRIGNYVTIYTGATILGDVKIGDNAVIAAGALVLDNVPPSYLAISMDSKATCHPIDYSKIYPEMNQPLNKKDILLICFGMVVFPVVWLFDKLGIIKIEDDNCEVD